MLKIALATFAVILTQAASAEEVFRIQVGRDYSRYSNEDLRRRVWELERAVAQLQGQVFALAMKGNAPVAAVNNWTCTMQSFGETHVASGNTKASALAQVIKKCSDASNAIHCDEDKAKCGND